MEQSRQAAKRARHRNHVAAQAAREEDRRRRETQRHRNALESRRQELHEQHQIERAVVLTEDADKRIQKMMVLLRASLKHIPGELDLEAKKKDIPDIDLGIDAEPFPLPQWEEYAPAAQGTLGRLFHGGAREARLTEAEEAYAKALERYRALEAERRQLIERLHVGQDDELSEQQREIRLHNRKIDDFRARVFAGDRYAVTEYFERVFAGVADKPPMVPVTIDLGKRVAYVPESKLVLVEWQVPDIDIVPREKEYRYNPRRDAIEVSKWRSIGAVREIYHNLLAQLALRAVASAFSADPNWLVETVVFNALVVRQKAGAGAPESSEAVPGEVPSEQDKGSCVFSMRATRHQFEKLTLADLTDTEPLEQARERFAAAISPFPDELVETRPILTYDLAEPGACAPEGAGPESARIDLNAMSIKELDRLLEQLLERMGYKVEVIRPDDNDCDALATRPTPEGTERIVVHLRRVTRSAGPGDVRTLQRAVRRERADYGLLLVTGGYDTRAFDYAARRPVQLYDRHSLLALLHRHGLATREDASPKVARLPRQRARRNDAPIRSAVARSR